MTKRFLGPPGPDENGVIEVLIAVELLQLRIIDTVRQGTAKRFEYGNMIRPFCGKMVNRAHSRNAIRLGILLTLRLSMLNTRIKGMAARLDDGRNRFNPLPDLHRRYPV